MSTAQMSLQIRVGRRHLRDHQEYLCSQPAMAIVDCALINIDACRIIQSVRVPRGALSPACTHRRRLLELTALSHLSMTHLSRISHASLTHLSLISHSSLTHSIKTTITTLTPRSPRAYTAPMSAPTPCSHLVTATNAPRELAYPHSHELCLQRCRR